MAAFTALWDVMVGLALTALGLFSLWSHLQIARYRQRWQAALKLASGDEESSSEPDTPSQPRWEVVLRKPSGYSSSTKWAVTNGKAVIEVCDADFQYSWAGKHRSSADRLAKELNEGLTYV